MINNRIASIFGESSKTTYMLTDSLKRESEVLIPDGLDGWNVMPFLARGMNVTMYEENKVFIEGGVLKELDQEITVDGFIKRLKPYHYSDDRIKCINANFYLLDSSTQYDLVFACKSLHRDINSSIALEEKIKKLKNAVKVGGSIYIFYHLALNDCQNNPNSYLLPNEMREYFNDKEWYILSILERKKAKVEDGHIGNPLPHKHRFGYIFAMKKSVDSFRKHIYSYNVLLC